MKFKFFSRMVLCAAAAIAMTSCSIDDEPDYVDYPETAYGVIANASPNSGDLYFFADNNKVNNTALNFGTAQGYFNFYTGNRRLSIKNAEGLTVATDSIALEPNDFFTAFAVNTYDNIELVTYRDSLVYPEANHALVRFINLSPDAAAVTINTPSDTLVTGLEFKGATQFISVAEGTYDFTFTNTATGQAIYTANDVEVYSDRIYTIYTKGFVTPASGSNDTFTAETIRNY
jgi:Domain of unknown function (DUF4397)